MKKIELLAPARDLECGTAAINCGADAVYIGAGRFGARERAGNSLADIEALVRHAHKFWARVYITLNTLLFDQEIPAAEKMARELFNIGADGLIVQDAGLLECDLPPLPLIASTQMHNHTPARVAFLEKVGFQRVILARELSIEQIREIRAATQVELECFIHGALCVCFSGQCLMSYALGGRSGNRGQCAQPCRRSYSLIDEDGKVLVHDRYLLSLKDLNLTDHLEDLIQAGVGSFKIEGRLKDKAYVMNVVSHYRNKIDQIIEGKALSRSSSGLSRVDFTPDLTKTFNRGYTRYFIDGRKDSPGSIHTPKMTGEPLGVVKQASARGFSLDKPVPMHHGDGICFFNGHHELSGTIINDIQKDQLIPDKMDGIHPGMQIFRNHDQLFLQTLNKVQAERAIPIQLGLEETPSGFKLQANDGEGNHLELEFPFEKVPAQNPGQATSIVEKQLTRLGGSSLACTTFQCRWSNPCFIPASTLNQWRRELVETFFTLREQNRPRPTGGLRKTEEPFPEKQLTYQGNILNQKAEDFYRRHGVEEIEWSAESGMDMEGEKVMTTRYCILHELGYCNGKQRQPGTPADLWLSDEEGRKFKLEFCCDRCEMEVYLA
jgi:23S rRNA 5-hydroxycytidine C2501 synthase